MLNKLTLGIRHRLFLAFLAAACCVIVCMYLVTRISFEQGAFRYVHTVEQERLEQLGRTLEQLYADRGDWSFFDDESTGWLELVTSTRPARPLFRDHRQHKEGWEGKGGPSPQFELPPPPMPKGEQIFELRVLLTDSTDRVLQGPTPPWPQSPHWLELEAGGRKIGKLGLIPPRILVDDRVKRFVQEQHRALIVIALGIAAGAALLSLPLAGRMVRRITALAAATNRLASGQYDVRVPAEATDELGQLARDFNRLAHTLGRNEELRRRWVADISHELRTPLAVLRGEVEAVQDNVRPLTPQTMSTLHAEILHLTRLVDDLYTLALADIGALTYHKQYLDLSALVSQAVQSCREQFDARGLALESAVPKESLPVQGDAERLRQLLHNILANALRYTDPGGTVRVEMHAQEDCIVLRCIDSAPGVPDEALGRLFDRLYRVEDSRSRDHGGAGLGLALCKSIVEAHDGTIEAAHSEAGGLEIVVTLPIDRCA